MIKKTVVDSSVIVKWLNADNEQHLEKSDKLLQQARDGDIELVAPELSKYEIGNVLLKGKQLSPEQARVALGTIYSLPITYVADSQELSQDTYSIAHKLGISYYDASFLSLAKQLDAILVTGDIKDQTRSGNVKVIPIRDY